MPLHYLKDPFSDVNLSTLQLNWTFRRHFCLVIYVFVELKRLQFLLSCNYNWKFIAIGLLVEFDFNELVNEGGLDCVLAVC